MGGISKGGEKGEHLFVQDQQKKGKKNKKGKGALVEDAYKKWVTGTARFEDRLPKCGERRAKGQWFSGGDFTQGEPKKKERENFSRR